MSGLPLLSQPHRDRGEIRARIDVRERARIGKSDSDRAQAVQQPPSGWMSTAHGDASVTAASALTGHTRTQRLNAIRRLSHRGTRSCLLDESREEIIRKQWHITGTDGERTRALISCPQSPTLTPAKGPNASPGTSYKRGSPAACARASDCVSRRTLAATTAQLRCRRAAAQRISGLPANSAAAFSPPNRTERPPASTRPTTPGLSNECSIFEGMIREGDSSR